MSLLLFERGVMLLKGDKWYQGKYLQGGLSDKTCSALLNLIENVDGVAGLKNCIQNYLNRIDIKRDRKFCLKFCLFWNRMRWHPIFLRIRL